MVFCYGLLLRDTLQLFGGGVSLFKASRSIRLPFQLGHLGHF